ncbi:hypothetical protein DS2_03475 [Catenovulum agarivorans DS-2]|uniref:Uncharacterized protein n=1 Tax=Catenovulum agarivorans DS-2 TaxID=1328313 RepID=W7QRB8_9ALTE|nr:hypothetical protein [Catenovulum agarivorans]EWH11537.1 hypothetical protein DS2_03475 [Catenovulum agarivorans DS-2]
MKKLLAAPVKMSLPESENQLYQNMLKNISDISLNLLAIKTDDIIEEIPSDFLTWCKTMHLICNKHLNYELLEAEQLPVVAKLSKLLEQAISQCQLKMLRITPWPIFVANIEELQNRPIWSEQQAFLHYIAQLRSQSFSQLISEDQLVYFGKHTAKHDPSIYTFDVEHFTGFRNAKNFLATVTHNADAIEKMLQAIPLQGEVTFAHYQDFVSQYVAMFEQQAEPEKAPLFPATRLLALHRPDVFISINSSKADSICAAFGLARLSNQDFLSYWNDLVASYQQMPWWKLASANNDNEQFILEHRAILLDLFWFADEKAHEQSNYYKALHKPSSSSVNKSASARRSGKSLESVSAMVDKVLAEDDMPAFVKANREAIIKQVMGGKKIEEVVGLMRSIFG